MKNTKMKHDDNEGANVAGKVVSVVIFSVLIGLTLFVRFSGNYEGGNKTVVAPSATKALRTATDTPLPSQLPTETSFPSTAILNPPSAFLVQISCVDVKNVNLRKSPGYIAKDDKKDVVYEIPCGEYVELLGENEFKDGLHWWRVDWNDYEGWIADHTGKGKQILAVDQTSLFSQSEPQEFIYWYFNIIWQERDYDALWGEYLTARFQNHSSPAGIREYSDWWDSVQRTDVNSVEVLKLEGRNARVKTRLTFYLVDGRVLKDRDYEYDLIYDVEKEIWMFDYHN